jgi:gliding motility-associated-like protein
MCCLLVAFTCFAQARSQTISITHFNNSPTFLQGGSISLHINPQDEFPFQTRFVLQLLNSEGTTVVNDNIGEVNDFFTPVINGTLPATLPAGAYRLRVQAFNGQQVITTSPVTPIFNVASSAAFTRPAISNPTGLILQMQCFSESNFLGSANNSVNVTTPSNFSFQIADYNPSFTYEVLFIDPSNGSVLNLPITILGGIATFNLPSGRPTGYYTLEIVKRNAIGSSSYAYTWIFATGNTSLGNLSSENVCVGEKVVFTNNREVILKNYPGSFYTVNYGDGSKIDTFTHARFIKDSVFAHLYNLPTCRAGSTLNQAGKYRAEIQLFNKGIRSGGDNRCNQYVQNGNGTIKLVNISLAPIAGLEGPKGTCINSAVSVLNKTLKGAYGTGNVCLTDPVVNWFLKAPNSTEFVPVPASWFDNPEHNLFIPENILNQIGVWQLKITTQNPEGCNLITEAIQDICVEPEIEASFLMNSKDSVVICVSPNVNLEITNTTTLTNVCSTPQFRWRVYNSQGELLIPGEQYEILPNDSAANPSFIFRVAGNYRIEMVVESYCLPPPASANVRVLPVGAAGAVRLPADKGYCGNDLIINFQDNPSHRVRYNTNDGSEKYKWTITGGNFTFNNGTSDTSRFPVIRFTDFGTYTVKVDFENVCGAADTFQVITFSEPITVDAGPDRTICFNQDTIFVNGTIRPQGTPIWSTTGSGSFESATALATYYELTTGDKLAGNIHLILRGNPPDGSYCPSVSDSLMVNILPDNSGANREEVICSGTRLNFNPSSSIPGSTFKWSSTVLSGTVSGNSASGTGLITDELYNPSDNITAVVVYTIVPTANGCDGTPFTYTVKVNPIPAFTATPALDTLCSATVNTINLSSSLTGISYNWTSQVISGALTGNSNGNNSSGPIADVLNNTGSTYAIVQYTITPVGPAPGACVGKDTTITLVVTPALTNAQAGPDQLLCDLSTTTLAANNPVIGIGQWTQVSGLPLTINNPLLHNTTVSGLQPGNVYVLRWTIADPTTVCTPRSDEVQITVRPQTTRANAGLDTSICGNGQTTFRLNGNRPLPHEAGRWFIVSSTFSPAPGLSGATSPNATISALKPGKVVMRWRITSDAPGCPTTNDTVVISIVPSTQPALAGPNQLLCNATTTTLQATAVSGTSAGRWSVIAPSPALVQQVNNPQSIVTDLAIGDNQLIWTVTDSICPEVNRDTVLITIRPPTTQAEVGDDTTFCITGNSSFTLRANAPAPFERVRWSVVSSDFSPSPSFSDALSPITYIVGLQPGKVTVRYTITSEAQDCLPTFDEKVLTVGPATAEANAGPDQLLCDVNSTTLNAMPVGGNSRGAWSVLPISSAVVADTANPNSVVNGLIPGSTTLVWTVRDQLCSEVNTDTVVLFVRPSTTPAKAGNDTAICIVGNSNFRLNANTPQPNENGRWTIVTSTMSPVPSFSSITSPNASLLGLKPGRITLRWTISSDAPGCLPSSDEITIDVSSATAEANAGPDQVLCNVTAAQLQASPVDNFSFGTWSVLNPSGLNIADPTNANATVTNLKIGENYLVWTVANSLCPGVNRDTVLIIVRPNTTPANAGPDTAFCTTNNPSYTLRANGYLSNEQGRWVIAANTIVPQPSINNLSNPNAVLSGLRPGSITLRWTITSDAPDCPVSQDEVTITVGPPTPDANAGPDQVLCNVTSTLLNATPVGGTSKGTWSVVPPAGAQVDDANAANSTVANLAIGTQAFVWKVTDALCPQQNEDTVLITVRPPTTTAFAGNDTAFCATGNTTFALNANTPAGFEQGRWTIISSSFSPTPSLSNPGAAQTNINGLKPGELVLRWTITSDAIGCDPTSDEVKLTIGNPSPDAFAGPDQLLCNLTGTTLDATPVGGKATGRWTVVAPSPAVVTNATDARSAVSNLLIGDNLFAWTVTDSLCSQINSDTMVVTVRPPTTIAHAGSDTIICILGNNAYTLSANTPKPFEKGFWTIAPGSTIIPIFSNLNDPKTTILGLRPGILHLRWTITSDAPGCDPSTDEVVITIADTSQAAYAGPDQNICGSTITRLAASPVTGINTGRWLAAQGTIATVVDTTNPTSELVNLPLGQSILIWEVTNNVCPANRDTVVINRFPALENLIGDTATICEGQSITLTNRQIAGGNGQYSYQWQSSTDNLLFTDIPGANAQSLTTSPVVTTWYRRLVTSLTCVDLSDTVKIVVIGGIRNNAISPSRDICINTSPGLITGTLPTGGGDGFVYTWQQSTDGGATWTTIPGAVQKDYNPGILTANVSYRRIVNTWLCDGPQRDTSNVVIMTIRPDAEAVMNPARFEKCATWTITNADLNPLDIPEKNSDYRWFVNDRLVASGIVFPGTTLTLPGDNVVIKLLAISRFGCLNDSLSFTFKTSLEPVPGFILSDTAGCGPLPVVITNITPQGSNYNFIWNFGQGQTSTQANPGTIIFPPDVNYGDTTYIVTLKAFGNCDTIITSQTVRVRSKPKSIFTPNRTDGCSPLNVTFRNTSLGLNNQYRWLFGDGNTLVSQDPIVTHRYITGVLDTFYAQLITANHCGEDTATFPIVVQPNTIVLDFAIAGTERFGCAPHTVSFINNSSGAILFNWDFGDGFTTSTLKNKDTVRHTYFAPGEYVVTVFATNGCSDTSDVERVTVKATPKVNFDAVPNTVCVGDTISFINQSEQATYRWAFGDGSFASTPNVKKTYQNSGTYKVTLRASLNYAEGLVCADSLTKDVVVVDTLPTQMFVSDSVGICTPHTVLFRSGVPNATEVIWDFGDGNTGRGQNVAHIYTTLGTYTVTMIAKVASGCNYKSVRKIEITGPSGTLRYNGGFVCAGEPVRLEVLSGIATRYIFMFGDGDSAISTTPIVSHVYSRPGVYVPYVILESGACRIERRTGDTIRVDRVRPGFRFDLTQVCGSTTVNFTDTSDAVFGVRTRLWNFGDGSSNDTLRNVSRIFTRTGNYRVVLYVTGNSGCIDSVVRNITIPVLDIPGINIKGNPILCEGGSNTLEADIKSTDSIAAIQWDFGNGQRADGRIVVANYVRAGNFTIRLTVRTIFGCVSTITRDVVVNPTPVVGASNDRIICRGQSTLLFANGATRYLWSPTNSLSCNDCASPVATPTVTTNYSVTGYNDFGCFSSDSVLVSVAQPFKITVNSSDSICIGSGMQLQASGAARYEWSPASGLSATNIANPFAIPTISTTYRVIGLDGVNCFSDTAFVRVGVGPIPTLDLGNGGLVVAGTRVTINARITGGPIRDYIWTPSTNLLSCANCPNPVVTVDNDIDYRLTIRNFYGCTATDTISFRIVCQQDQVFIPNAFSPDGDGINDVLYVMGKGVARVKSFRIFNRFGQVVFDRANFDINDPSAGWDGKINGVPASPDVYVYTAEVLCTGGATYRYKGNVTLFR